jgi:hypothetical protein
MIAMAGKPLPGLAGALKLPGQHRVASETGVWQAYGSNKWFHWVTSGCCFARADHERVFAGTEKTGPAAARSTRSASRAATSGTAATAHRRAATSGTAATAHRRAVRSCAAHQRTAKSGTNRPITAGFKASTHDHRAGAGTSGTAAAARATTSRTYRSRCTTIARATGTTSPARTAWTFRTTPIGKAADAPG